MKMSKDEKEEEKKVDVKSLVNIIPPASSLKKSKAPPKEKRVKMKKRPDVDQGIILISSKLATELGISDEAEVSIKGKRAKFKVIIQDGLPDTEIYGNDADMIKLGLEDNSTVSVRASK
ncbi:hypothetical protein [Sulfurisphaera ohwakuensis]|uniref:Uncharacterized protein n=2 Tax=Sulfurisphaera ohwakuensis TaxID=69656 RepID=A0A7J9RRA9_SULOH|nr:hypothetical protein [Sulfurisphaera ohwakuensis]MBB5253076.1 hypothetical protein [Sulfurisphaera ohwakuensis]